MAGLFRAPGLRWLLGLLDHAGLERQRPQRAAGCWAVVRARRVEVRRRHLVREGAVLGDGVREGTASEWLWNRESKRGRGMGEQQEPT